MPKSYFKAIFIGKLWVAAWLLAGCGEPAAEAKPAAGSPDIAGYSAWTYRQLGVAGSGHGGGNVYANDVAQNYLSKAAPTGTTSSTVLSYPEDSIIVYERLKAGAYVETLVMRKTQNPPEGAKPYAGWSWAERKSPGGPDAYQGDVCVKCHDQANDDRFRDGVHVFPDCQKGITCP